MSQTEAALRNVSVWSSYQVARAELELLRDCRSGLSKLTNRVSKLKQVQIEHVLGSVPLNSVLSSIARLMCVVLLYMTMAL